MSVEKMKSMFCKFCIFIKALTFKDALSVIALLISVTSLIIASSNRNESIDISKVGVLTGKINGLISYRNEIHDRFSINAKRIIDRTIKVKGESYLIANKNKIKYAYILKTLMDLINTNRKTFFQRHEMKDQYNALLSVISMEDLLNLSEFIYSEEFLDIEYWDFDKLDKYTTLKDISVIVKLFDNLLEKIDLLLLSYNEELEKSYNSMLSNGTINIEFAKAYYNNIPNTFGFVKAQLDFWESVGTSKTSQTEQMIQFKFSQPVFMIELMGK